MGLSNLDLGSLNPDQYRAVTTLDGPMLVVAGAGSGKTRVLTYRIAHLLERGISAEHVLALTFTNKAARVMKDRIGQLVGVRARGLSMGTFHSIFLRILRSEATRIGFSSSFSVYDTSASRAMLKRIVHDLELSIDTYDPVRVLSRISQAKNNLSLPSHYRMNESARQQDERSKRPMIASIYEEYHSRMRGANAMDFDDILVYTFLLLYRYPDVLSAHQDRFRYILVDEYQDTNEVQNRILHLLAGRHQNICVVGDDAQSIYAFRGAKIQNILNFPNRYPSCQRVTLAMNYRSTSAIVESANRLISHNPHQIPKECVAQTSGGSAVRIKVLGSGVEEARYVAEYIQELALRSHVSYDHFAILYRSHALSRELEVALRQRDIPYIVYKGQSFWQRKEVLDLMAYFRLCVNPQDSESLLRVINFPPRGIGATTLGGLYTEAHRMGISLWQLLLQLDRVSVQLRPATRLALSGFVCMIQRFHSSVSSMEAMALAEEVYGASGLKAHYAKDISEEGEARCMNLGEVLSAIDQFVATQESAEDYESHVITLAEFLDQCSLASDSDVEDEAEHPRVVLATVHASKGLEYDYVCVVGLEEGGFPSQRSLQEPNGVEEERRLCYVAVTRAAKQLLLTSARERFQQGSVQLRRPSRFLQELDPDFQGWRDRAAARRETLRLEQGSAFPHARREYPPPGVSRRLVPLAEAVEGAKGEMGTDPSRLSVGCRVVHARYGHGTVMGLQDEGMAAKAIVRFDAFSGEKTLMLHFVHLQVV